MRSRRTDISLLLLRMILGVVFAAHGAQKLFGLFGGKGLSDFAGHITSMGMPPIVATLVAIGEFFGGLGVLVGLVTRIAALGPISSMLGAVFLVHLKNGFFMQPEKPGYEYALTLLVVSLAILISGPGRYSLDAALHRGREFAYPRALPKAA